MLRHRAVTRQCRHCQRRVPTKQYCREETGDTVHIQGHVPCDTTRAPLAYDTSENKNIVILPRIITKYTFCFGVIWSEPPEGLLYLITMDQAWFCVKRIFWGIDLFIVAKQVTWLVTYSIWHLGFLDYFMVKRDQWPWKMLRDLAWEN